MAKNGTANGNNNEEDLSETETQKLTPAERKAILKPLFAAYSEAQAAVEAAEQIVAEAIQKRSETVKEIYEKGGPGPYQYGGNVSTISKRGENYYFRGRNKAEIEAIG